MQNVINIGDEQRPVSFGTLFMFNFQEEKGYSPLSKLTDFIAGIPKDAPSDLELGASFFDKLDFAYMVEVTKHALIAGAQLQGKVLEIDIPTLSLWIDNEGGLNVLMNVMGMMFKSLPTGKAEQKATGTKKKLKG